MEVTCQFNKFKIYDILKSYHWKLREIIQLEKDLQKTDFSGVAQYGIESTLPHAIGIVGKAIENEIIRRSKKSERIYEYAKEVNFINENMHKVKDERQKVVLDCMLDGFGISAIAHHMQTNRKFIHKMIDDIVDVLTND